MPRDLVSASEALTHCCECGVRFAVPVTEAQALEDFSAPVLMVMLAGIAAILLLGLIIRWPE